jgi:hypothetical protein
LWETTFVVKWCYYDAGEKNWLREEDRLGDFTRARRLHSKISVKKFINFIHRAIESYWGAGHMDQGEGFIDTHSDTGQMERLMDCIAFSKVLAGIYDMETLLIEVLQRLNAIIRYECPW